MKNYLYTKVDFEDTGEELAKTQIVDEIKAIMRERNLTQTQVKILTGIPQSRISTIMGGRHDDISVGRLLEAVRCLGRDIDIIIRKQTETQVIPVGKLKVSTE